MKGIIETALPYCTDILVKQTWMNSLIIHGGQDQEQLQNHTWFMDYYCINIGKLFALWAPSVCTVSASALSSQPSSAFE